MESNLSPEAQELIRKMDLVRKDRKIVDLGKKAKTIANEINHRRDFLLKQNGIPLETFLSYLTNFFNKS